MPQDIDLSYLGLTPDERTADDVIADALSFAQTQLPDWIPRNGAIEVIVLEAAALVAAEIEATLNNLPGRVVEGVLNLYGVPRSAGTVASGAVTITFDTTVTTTIPVGTRFVLPDYGLDLVSTAEVSVSVATTASVSVSTDDYTGLVNGVGASASVDLLDAIPNAQSVAISTPLTGGSDPESDDAYLDRASTVLARVTSSLVVAEHFTAYALQDVRVQRATTVDLWDVTVGTGSVGDYPGEISVYVYGIGGLVDDAVKTELEESMQERSAAMMDVHVADAEVTTQNVELEVVALPGYDTGVVQAAVEAAVDAWLDPSVWTWDEDIRPNDIIALADGIAGVDYVVSVTTPSTVTSITTPGGLADAGTITVTVS